MTSPITARVRKHRQQLEVDGLKPIQIWIPDTRSASFRQRCERESLSLPADQQEAEVLAWMAEIADTDGWA